LGKKKLTAKNGKAGVKREGGVERKPGEKEKWEYTIIKKSWAASGEDQILKPRKLRSR